MKNRYRILNFDVLGTLRPVCNSARVPLFSVTVTFSSLSTTSMTMLEHAMSTAYPILFQQFPRSKSHNHSTRVGHFQLRASSYGSQSSRAARTEAASAAEVCIAVHVIHTEYNRYYAVRILWTRGSTNTTKKPPCFIGQPYQPCWADGRWASGKNKNSISILRPHT